MPIEVPTVVRNKAIAAGTEAWLAGLPTLLADLEREWSITVGKPYADSTEAFVAAVTRQDGSPAVVKLVIPRTGHAARNEIRVLRLANGRGCPELLEEDESRGALLLERLGASLFELAPPAPGAARDPLCGGRAALATRTRLRTPHGRREGPLARRLHHEALGGAGPSVLGACRRLRAVVCGNG